MVHAMGLSEWVCFLGAQLHFLEVLENSDVFLLPSETESFGLAALEAMSCGVPVVASRVGGLPEVVIDGEQGFLHRVGDIAGMVGSVRQLLEDASLYQRMSTAARQWVEEKWKREPMVDRYEDYYRRVLSKSG